MKDRCQRTPSVLRYSAFHSDVAQTYRSAVEQAEGLRDTQ